MVVEQLQNLRRKYYVDQETNSLENNLWRCSSLSLWMSCGVSRDGSKFSLVLPTVDVLQSYVTLNI